MSVCGRAGGRVDTRRRSCNGRRGGQRCRANGLHAIVGILGSNRICSGSQAIECQAIRVGSAIQGILQRTRAARCRHGQAAVVVLARRIVGCSHQAGDGGRVGDGCVARDLAGRIVPVADGDGIISGSQTVENGSRLECDAIQTVLVQARATRCRHGDLAITGVVAGQTGVGHGSRQRARRGAVGSHRRRGCEKAAVRRFHPDGIHLSFQSRKHIIVDARRVWRSVEIVFVRGFSAHRIYRDGSIKREAAALRNGIDRHGGYSVGRGDGLRKCIHATIGIANRNRVTVSCQTAESAVRLVVHAIQ